MGPLRYRLAETELGWVALVLSPRGLRAVGLPCPSPEEARQAALSLGAAEEAGPGEGEEAARLLQDYARGRPVSFAGLALDWEGLSSFRRQVLEEVRAVPWGQTVTYAWLAARLGRPRGARAVGQALARNPFPIVVPCHRVVGADGSLGGYGGGLALKERLLALEGVRRPPPAPRAR